jgi:hypothetical protein
VNEVVLRPEPSFRERGNEPDMLSANQLQCVVYRHADLESTSPAPVENE